MNTAALQELTEKIKEEKIDNQISLNFTLLSFFPNTQGFVPYIMRTNLEVI